MNEYDQVFFVEIDRINNVFLLGQSVGGNFPINNAAYSNGASSNFVIKLDSLLSTNLASTRFGNGSTDIQISPAAFLVDNCGNIYISGWGANILQANTQLNGMPVTVDALQATPAGGADFYLMVMAADMSDIVYGSYIGGATSDEHVDGGTSRFDKNGIVYQCVCAGCGGNDDFPTTPGAWSSVNNSSNCNAAVYKFDSGLLPLAEFTVDQTIGCNDFTVTFDNNSSASDTYLWDFGDGELDSTTFNPVVTYTDAGTYQVFLYVTDSICQLTDTAQIFVIVVDSVIIDVASPVNLCNNDPYDLSVNTYGTAYNFIWSMNPDFSSPLNIPGDSVITITTSGTYYIQVSNAFCSTDDSVVVLFDAPPVAEFNLLDSIGCAPLLVSFDNLSVQTSYFLWDFGNGALDSITFEPAINYTDTGTFDVSLLIYDSICAFYDTAYATITVLPDVTIVPLDSILVCNQSNTPLTANSNGTATTFIWSSLPDFSIVLNPGNDSTIMVSAEGMYYVQLSNDFCTIEDSVYVDFSEAPLADFTIDNTQGCSPVTVSFTNNSVPNSGFLWDFGNGTQDSLNFNTTITFDDVGTFQVVLFIYDDVCAIFDTDTAQVTVSAQPTIDLVDTIELCVAVSTTISPTTTGATQFVWSTNNMFSDTLNSPITDPNVIIDPPVAGYYFIEASNADCFVLDSVVFVFIEPELSMSAEDSICVGDITEVTVTNLNPTISLTYDWQPTSVLINPGNVSSVFANPTFSQYIYVTGTSTAGCLVSDSIFINVSDIDSTMVIASSSDYSVAPGTTVTLFGSPSGLSSYQWIPDTGLSAPTNQQTDAVINEDIIYTLTVSDGICTRDDTVEIKVYEIICEDPYVFVPNAFSPNGDGYNDILYVRGLYIEKVIFRIFDRWGELVFESNDVTIGWDGTFRNVPLQPDVYDYYLDVTCVGGLKSIVKGNITLMR
jgi:gliding motility-associated-like protein